MTSEKDWAAMTRAVSCPVCKAKPGEDCDAPMKQNKPAELWRFHVRRLDRARRIAWRRDRAK